MEILIQDSRSLLKPEEQKNIICWSDNSFGRGYLSPSYLKSLYDRSVIIKSYDQGQLIGLAWLIMQKTHELPDSLKAHCPKTDKPIIYRKFILVDPDHRSRGIASELMDKIDQFSEEYPFVYTSIWQKEGIKSYHDQLVSRAYQAGEFIEDFWAEESLNRKFICAYCQNIPCRCSARLFYKVND